MSSFDINNFLHVLFQSTKLRNKVCIVFYFRNNNRIMITCWHFVCRPFVCKLFKLSTSSPEPQCQFLLNLAQRTTRKRECIVVKVNDHVVLEWLEIIEKNWPCKHSIATLDEWYSHLFPLASFTIIILRKDVFLNLN